MASIGSVACSILRGNPRPQQERVETFEIPGIDGVGVHLYGRGGGEWEAEAVVYDSAANVDVWYSAIAALQGSIVAVVNDWPETSTCLILSVGPLDKRVALGEGGCRGAVRLALQTMG